MESGSDTPTPIEIRDRIRREHHQLAARLTRIETLAREAQPGEAAAFLALRNELDGLRTALDEHLHYEEYRLPSLAEDVENVAEVHETMRHEHAAQRELLKRVIEDLDETAVGRKLLVGVTELTRAIRDDMMNEENEILSKI